MAVGSSIKQNYALAFLSEQEMPVGGAIMIPVFNTIFNSANSIPSLTTAANAFTLSFLSTENDSGAAPLLVICSVVYLIGLLTEATSEQQRKTFKNDPKNAGKPFTGGLFGLARHINYGAYTVWRGAYALASSLRVSLRGSLWIEVFLYWMNTATKRVSSSSYPYGP